METTIIKRVKGCVMETIFDRYSDICNVRYYNSLNLKDEEDFIPEKTYKYEIRIRHSEGTNANDIFELAKKRSIKFG